MKKAGLYIRVSTPQQEKEGYSIEAQTEKLNAYALAKDYKVFKTYTDAAFSGAKLERPALNEMIEDIESNKIDVVIVYKLDRLSRSQKNTMYLIEDVFLKNNVDFISMQESFDTTTSFGRAMIGILSVFAQLERDNITERMSMGKLERVKRGYYMGGGNVPFGYEYNLITGELEIQETQALTVKRMFELFLSGQAINKIVSVLKKEFPVFEDSFMDSTVRRRLQSHYYCGKQKYQNKVYDAKHEPIVSIKDFNKAQRLISNRPHSNAFNHSYLFSGLIICHKCGKPYNGYESVRTANGKKYKHKYYRCSCRTYKHKQKYGWACSGKSYRCDFLDAAIMSEIKKRAENSKFAIKEDNNEVDNKPIIREIARLNAQQSKLLDLYLSDKISTNILDNKTDELKEKIEKLELQLNQTVSKKDKEEFEKSLEELVDKFEETDFSTRRSLIENIIEKIEVVDDEITIYFYVTI